MLAISVPGKSQMLCHGFDFESLEAKLNGVANFVMPACFIMPHHKPFINLTSLELHSKNSVKLALDSESTSLESKSAFHPTPHIQTTAATSKLFST